MKSPRSIQLSMVTFPHGPLAPFVRRCLHELRLGQGVELLDVLHVSRDSLGNLEVSTDPIDFHVGPSYGGLALRQLLEGDQVASSAVCEHQMHSAAAVGFDLDRLDALAYQIPLGSSALLVLVEAGWTELLFDAVSRAGGVTRALGFLEAESMLVAGPHLQDAQHQLDDAVRAIVASGLAQLDELRNGSSPEVVVVASTLTALVAGGALRESDLAAAVAILAEQPWWPGSRDADSG